MPGFLAILVENVYKANWNCRWEMTTHLNVTMPPVNLQAFVYLLDGFSFNTKSISHEKPPFSVIQKLGE